MDPPPFRMTAIPWPLRTSSSKTILTAAGACARTAPFAGSVRTSVACAAAPDGSRRATRTAAGSDFTSRDIAARGASVALVLFRQFVDDDLGCGSYLVGDEQAGVAAVIDPGYAVEQYVDAC